MECLRKQPGGRGQGQEAAEGVAGGMPRRRPHGAGLARAGGGATASPQPCARAGRLACLSPEPGRVFLPGLRCSVLDRNGRSTQGGAVEPQGPSGCQSPWLLHWELVLWVSPCSKAFKIKGREGRSGRCPVRPLISATGDTAFVVYWSATWGLLIGHTWSGGQGLLAHNHRANVQPTPTGLRSILRTPTKPRSPPDPWGKVSTNTAKVRSSLDLQGPRPF